LWEKKKENLALQCPSPPCPLWWVEGRGMEKDHFAAPVQRRGEREGQKRGKRGGTEKRTSRIPTKRKGRGEEGKRNENKFQSTGKRVRKKERALAFSSPEREEERKGVLSMSISPSPQWPGEKEAGEPGGRFAKSANLKKKEEKKEKRRHLILPLCAGKKKRGNLQAWFPRPSCLERNKKKKGKGGRKSSLKGRNILSLHHSTLSSRKEEGKDC